MPELPEVETARRRADRPTVKAVRLLDPKLFAGAQDGWGGADRAAARGAMGNTAIGSRNHLDQWAKNVAPSPQLRTWYGHDPAKFEEFRRRYAAELKEPERAEALAELRELAHAKPLLLLTATRDLEHSQAAVLAEKLR